MGNSSSGMGIGPLILPRILEGGGGGLGRPRPAFDADLNSPMMPTV